MTTLSYLFEALTPEQESKVEITKNYVVQDVKDKPPKSEIKTYRRKVIYDKTGQRHLLNLAILKNGKGTKLTSLWHPKTESSTKKLVAEASKVHIKKINSPQEM